MSEEEKNVRRLSSAECAQTICTCLHGHALLFTCFWCVQFYNFLFISHDHIYAYLYSFLKPLPIVTGVGLDGYGYRLPGNTPGLPMVIPSHAWCHRMYLPVGIQCTTWSNLPLSTMMLSTLWWPTMTWTSTSLNWAKGMGYGNWAMRGLMGVF